MDKEKEREREKGRENETKKEICKESQVIRQVILLEKHIIKIIDWVGFIEECMISVLRTSDKSEIAEESPREDLVPLADQISNTNRKLERLLKQIESISERLEL